MSEYWQWYDEQKEEEPQGQEADAAAVGLGEPASDPDDLRDLLATEAWILPTGDSGVPVMRPPGGTVVTVPQLQSGRGAEGHSVQPHEGPTGHQCETSEHMIVCKICGSPVENHFRACHPFLPYELHPGPRAVDWDGRFLELAQLVATWSKDPSTKVGSVIVDAKRRVLSVGYNGFPRGLPDDPATLAKRDAKLSMTVHAEMNAILNTGVPTSLEGATLYSSLYPCNECAKAIIQSGIARVVTYAPTSAKWKVAHDTASQMFDSAGVDVLIR